MQNLQGLEDTKTKKACQAVNIYLALDQFLRETFPHFHMYLYCWVSVPGCDHISVEPLHGSWITRSVDIVLIQLISSLIPAFKPIIHSRKSPKKIYRKVINLSTPKPLAPQGAPFEKCVLLTHVNPRNFMKPFPHCQRLGGSAFSLFGWHGTFSWGARNPPFPYAPSGFLQVGFWRGFWG